MISLNDILWGDQLENPDDGEPGDGTDTGVMPQAIKINCLAMCCGLDGCGPIPCASGRLGCK